MAPLSLGLSLFLYGGQLALLGTALPQAHEEGLGEGEDVHIIAQVHPGEGGEAARVLEGVGELAEDDARQPVAIECQRLEAGQRGQRGQQQ